MQVALATQGGELPLWTFDKAPQRLALPNRQPGRESAPIRCHVIAGEGADQSDLLAHISLELGNAGPDVGRRDPDRQFHTTKNPTLPAVGIILGRDGDMAMRTRPVNLFC
jgi:hypothetical protein